jgi:SAM-dependent methyltransferase
MTGSVVRDGGYERTAHLYDLFDQKPNIEFLCRHATQAKSVLDIGAGTGRIAIPLAERGIEVVCIEPSPAMRREFERKLAQRPDLGSRIQLAAADARSFDVGRTFSVALLSGTFDHFLDDEERHSSLLNIGRHLLPNGILLFDVFLGLMEDSPLSLAGVVQVGDAEVRRYVGGKVLADRTKETKLVFEIYRGGQPVVRIEERSLVGIVTREEVHWALDEAGFSVQNEWSSYDLRKFRDGDSPLIVEAMKKR